MKYHHKIPKAYVLLFFVILLSPLTLQMLKVNTNKLDENRLLAKAPPLSSIFTEPHLFPKKFEQYYDDNFALRSALIRGARNLRYYIFNSSISQTVRKKVLPGKDGWLFLKEGKKHGPIALHQGKNLLTETELTKISDKMNLWAHYFKSKNITFILLIAPNKHTIYSEHMPSYIKRGAITRTDQILKQLQTHSNIKIVYPKDRLLSNKELGPLYYKNDTHWTSLGAFLTYEQLSTLLHKSFPQIQPMTLDDVKINIEYGAYNATSYDLAKMASLDTVQDWKITTTANNKEFKIISNKTDLENKLLITTNSNSSSPKVVVFRDSFMEALYPFISMDTYKAVYSSKGDIDQQLIAAEEPNLAIFEIVERGAGDALINLSIPH